MLRGVMVHTVTPALGRSEQEDHEFKASLSCVKKHPPKLQPVDPWTKNAGMAATGLKKRIHSIRNDKAITLSNTADKI